MRSRALFRARNCRVFRIFRRQLLCKLIRGREFLDGSLSVSSIGQLSTLGIRLDRAPLRLLKFGCTLERNRDWEK